MEAGKRAADSLDDDPLHLRCAFRRGTDARSIPRIRIPGEHTRDRSRGALVSRWTDVRRTTLNSDAVLEPEARTHTGGLVYRSEFLLPFCYPTSRHPQVLSNTE